MPTTLDDIYAAANGIMADVNTAASTTLAQAPTNYGTDFRIPSGEARYQVRLLPVKPYVRSSNDSHDRAIVKILIHHYVSTLANEEAFLHNAMSFAAAKLLDSDIWDAESGVFGLQHDIEPEIEEASRVGNVITFEASAVVLADAA